MMLRGADRLTIGAPPVYAAPDGELSGPFSKCSNAYVLN